ncbi:MAG: glycosyltransferase [Solirubrobacteraceae bacterium]
MAFDSRPAATMRGVGHYTRCVLAALRGTAPEGVEIVETHRPSAAARGRRAHVFHSPWIEGAMLRSPCPMVVTVHDVNTLTRLSERLRCGGVHSRLRHLAVARATHVIVPTEAIAEDAVTKLGLDGERVIVIPEALDPSAGCATSGSPTWGWEDVAHATWQVYERALSEPARAFIRPRAISTR